MNRDIWPACCAPGPSACTQSPMRPWAWYRSAWAPTGSHIGSWAARPLLMPPSMSFTERTYPIAESPPFFEGVDMDRQIGRQKAFLTMAFGGPHNYTGADLRRGHQHLVARGLNDSHFDAVVELLSESLMELGVAPALIAQVTVIAESTRNDLLNR